MSLGMRFYTGLKFAYFRCTFERRKVDKKQTYMKTETCKLYSRVFRTFKPNFIKIDPYNFELYCFKFGAFLRLSVSENPPNAPRLLSEIISMVQMNRVSKTSPLY